MHSRQDRHGRVPVSDLDKVLDHLKNRHVFLTGGAGVGKSYTTNEVIRRYRDEGKNVVSLGSTGVSAVNIGGFTIHSFFVFGICDSFEALKQSDKHAKKRLAELKKILQAADLIVIDEISMVSTELFDMIAYRLQSSGYLGKILVVGDFFQLPPVRKNVSDHLFGRQLYAFESSSWRAFDFEVVELTQMMRTHDVEFTRILHKIRIGDCDDEMIAYLSRLWNNETGYDKEPTMLFGRNQEVDAVNRAKIDALEGVERNLVAHAEQFGRVADQKLESWKKLLPISEILTLKVGAPVLFTVNKWGKFVNGERGILRAIEDDCLIVEKDDLFVKIERHDFDLLEMTVADNGSIDTLTLARLSQFPIKLAYAVTIHKSQGMSIKELVCNIDHIFAPSQFYVAISRAVDPKTLKIDFNRGDLVSYLKRIIRIDERVMEYYGDLQKAGGKL